MKELIPSAQAVSTVARPTLEAAGMVTGGLLAPRQEGPSGQQRGALGFGMGSQGSRPSGCCSWIKRAAYGGEGFKEAGQHLKDRGSIRGPWRWRSPPLSYRFGLGRRDSGQKGTLVLAFTKRGMEKTAGETLQAVPSKGPIIVTNLAEAEK